MRHERRGPPHHGLASAFQLHDITPFSSLLRRPSFRRCEGATAGGGEALPIAEARRADGDPIPALLGAAFALLLTALGVRRLAGWR
jgi:hypothetical protein